MKSFLLNVFAMWLGVKICHAGIITLSSWKILSCMVDLHASLDATNYHAKVVALLKDKSFLPVCQNMQRVAAFIICKGFFSTMFVLLHFMSLNAKILTLFTSERLLSWMSDLVLLEVRSKRIQTVCRWKAFLLNGKVTRWWTEVFALCATGRSVCLSSH